MTKSSALYLLKVALEQLQDYSPNEHAVGESGSFHIPTAQKMLNDATAEAQTAQNGR